MESFTASNYESMFSGNGTPNFKMFLTAVKIRSGIILRIKIKVSIVSIHVFVAFFAQRHQGGKVTQHTFYIK